jgi:hypothetical protein
MSKWEEQTENTLFVAWGKKKAKENSYVIEKDETLECVMEKIKPSDKGYRYIYQVRTKGVEPALILLGCSDLNNKLGYGNVGVKPVAEGDEVRITFTGMQPTKNKKEMYTFKVLVKRA